MSVQSQSPQPSSALLAFARSLEVARDVALLTYFVSRRPETYLDPIGVGLFAGSEPGQRPHLGLLLHYSVLNRTMEAAPWNPDLRRIRLADVDALTDPVAEDFNGYPDWMKEAYAYVIGDVETQATSGDPVLGLGGTGVLGAHVTWGGTKGFITAGHVVRSGPNVTVGGMRFPVAWANDPTGSGKAVEVDAAVIDCGASAVKSPAVVSGPGNASSWDAVEIHAGGTILKDNIIGLLTTAWIPSSFMTLGDTYLTSRGVTKSGHSGAAATLAGTDIVVGHVVSGIPGVASFLQSASYQLARIGTPGSPFAGISI